MKKTTINLLSASLLALGSHVYAQNQKNISFSAKLDGAQETPANTSTAVGVAHLTLTPNMDSLLVRVDYTGLQSAYSSAHIHIGAVGVSGGVAFTLPAPSNNTITDVITGASLTPSVLANLFTSNYYVNIHSANQPNGELRGQIYAEADYNFSCVLDAAQEVPAPNNASVFGVALFNLAKHKGTLTYNVVMNNLSGAISSGHIHKGITGVAGGVVTTLNLVGANRFMGSVDPTPFLTALFADSLYINVHTAANPNGEARGQLSLTKGLSAWAVINGAQETPSVTTKATGVGGFSFNGALDSIFVAVAMDSLSGAVSGAHLHTGAMGVSGGVAINLSSGIISTGNGILYKGAVTPSQINMMINDGIYFNAHTSANPNGEVRGQLVPFARYTGAVCLNGGQEVPTSTSTATGGGIVSVSRDMSNAHVMYVASGLSSAETSTHIHNGVMGVSGGVAYDLSSAYMNNGVFTYLKSTDASPFTMAAAHKDLADSLYINIHTTNFPNGEVRGQIGMDCAMMATGIAKASTTLSNVSVYPNPAINDLNINIPAVTSEKTSVKIYDVIGNVVISQDYNAVNLISLNIAALNKGLYVVQITNGNQVSQSKIIKN
jgi:hypothetical protein